MTDTISQPLAGPVDTTPLSFVEGVDAIENLLSDDPEMDLEGSDEATGSEAPADSEVDEDDIELSLDDDEEGEAVESETEGPSITDDTEIMLDDGEKITLAQLKRNNLFQRDYSRKLEALKQQREQLDREHSERVTETETELRQKRDLVFELYKHVLPEEPSIELLQTDPVGFMEQKAAHEQRLKQLNHLWSQKTAEQKAAEEKAAAQFEEFKDAEWSQFLTKVPRLKDGAKLQAFQKDVSDIAVGSYGLKAEELEQLVDSRYMHVLHDAIAYRKLLAKQKTVQATVKAKPKLQGQQRMSIQDVKERDAQGRFQQLKKHPNSIDAAVRSIMDTL